ncbi:hypothetical protein PUN28_000244 [Cardiocondyla obscurior]|uniref:Uncharacterized protein n=1 Tax=Cardiocondyla obscurior TaxID=286306 RepID=A0AAW2GYC7_9HYME
MRRSRSTACHSRHSERRRRPRKGIGRRRSSSTDLGVLYIPDILRGGGGLGKASGVDATTRRYYRAVIADISIYTNRSQIDLFYTHPDLYKAIESTALALLAKINANDFLQRLHRF